MEGKPSQPTTGKGKILCVDDDPEVLRMLDLLLRNNGYDTVLGHDGEEAVRLFRQHKKDLVAGVLDLRMPKKDGMGVAREIRKESTDVPLIALSAYLSGTSKDNIPIKQCEEAGFNAYTQKPFSVEPFLLTINECVRNYIERRKKR